MEDNSSSLILLTSAIVGAFVGNNSTDQADLPSLIATVHQALRNVDEPETPAPAETIKLTAAQIRRSITPDALISFEDGRGYKALKRHLTARGMSLAEYKAKWGLAKDYPTTAPNYSAMRSQMAKALGLGQGIAKQVEPPAPEAISATPRAKRAKAPASAPARRGRPKKDAPKAI